MGHFVHYLLLLLVLSPSFAFARCHGGYAAHLIEARFTGCDGNKLNDAIMNDPSWEGSCGKKVSEVCMDGCYFPRTKEEEKQCDNLYAVAITPCEDVIALQAKKLKCQDEGKYLAGVEIEDVDKNCEWISRTPGKLDCGKEQTLVCFGNMVCSKPSKIGSATYPPNKTYGVGCVAQNGSCEHTPLGKCIKDENVSIDRVGQILPVKKGANHDSM